MAQIYLDYILILCAPLFYNASSEINMVDKKNGHILSFFHKISRVSCGKKYKKKIYDKLLMSIFCNALGTAFIYIFF